MLIGFTNIKSQNRYYFGGNIGSGSIEGNSPSISALSLALFSGVKIPSLKNSDFRIKFNYSRKINYFLPGDNSDTYSPYLMSLDLKYFFEQTGKSIFFTQEGIGVVAINDRIFRDRNEMDLGIVAEFLWGVDLRKNKSEGFRLGISAEFANTFTNSTANFYLFNIQIQYFPN